MRESQPNTDDILSKGAEAQSNEGMKRRTRTYRTLCRSSVKSEIQVLITVRIMHDHKRKKMCGGRTRRLVPQWIANQDKSFITGGS